MRCFQCGNKATIKDTDPYLDEFPELLEKDEENKEEWWCEDCYQDRLNSI